MKSKTATRDPQALSHSINDEIKKFDRIIERIEAEYKAVGNNLDGARQQRQRWKEAKQLVDSNALEHAEQDLVEFIEKYGLPVTFSEEK